MSRFRPEKTCASTSHREADEFSQCCSRIFISALDVALLRYRNIGVPEYALNLLVLNS
jgi:hypothetical protein